MNELLLKFAKQAGLKGQDETWISQGEAEFAKLIIQECCKMMIDLEIRYPANLTVREIKRHFGVDQ